MTASSALGKRFESFVQIKGLQSADPFFTDAEMTLTITLFVLSKRHMRENLATHALSYKLSK